MPEDGASTVFPHGRKLHSSWIVFLGLHHAIVPYQIFFLNWIQALLLLTSPELRRQELRSVRSLSGQLGHGQLRQQLPRSYGNPHFPLEPGLQVHCHQGIHLVRAQRPLRINLLNGKCHNTRQLVDDGSRHDVYRRLDLLFGHLGPACNGQTRRE